jgi:hypothetical protein
MSNPNELQATQDLSGVVRTLGDLPDGTIINEEALAKMFDRCQASIKRAIQRGELPPPVKLLGMPVWTVGKILSYLNNRLEIAQKNEEITRKKFENLDI